MNNETITAAYMVIMESDTFRIGGPEIDLPQALIDLSDSVMDADTDSSTWSIGEGLECYLDCL
ncbi:MAG: hypothetical protein JKY67_00340 [Pseudomonadales bacterium]|nr:hypothetical protein [Pseudomonadales bacterium]